jgi:predicted phosphodiesterase
MKFSLCSDLHLEFGDIQLTNVDNTEVLILAGDICVAQDLMVLDDTGTQYFSAARSQRYHDFFQRCAQEWNTVIYIMGNHEHYHGDFAQTKTHLKQCLGYIPNLHILEKECLEVSGINFVCGTLWTDMNSECLDTMQDLSKRMNDFRIIKNSQAQGAQNFKPRFHVEDALQDHKYMRAFIRDQLRLSYTQKIVVVGHHAPSKLSTHPRYQKDTLMNGGYSSDLTKLILSNPQIKTWVHGHTHEPFDYQIGQCRVVCNPRGYVGHEAQADAYQPKTIEV